MAFLGKKITKEVYSCNIATVAIRLYEEGLAKWKLLSVYFFRRGFDITSKPKNVKLNINSNISHQVLPRPNDS